MKGGSPLRTRFIVIVVVALAGLAFIVLSVIGDLSSGSPPGTDDSAAKIASFFKNHHRGVIVSVS